MDKTLLAVLGGVFLGAVAVEVVRKKYPEYAEKFYATLAEVGATAKEAFKEGYASVPDAPKAAEAEA